jgi:1-pyrroline-4-hydroxy-2-carboxylate deaminase
MVKSSDVPAAGVRGRLLLMATSETAATDRTVARRGAARNGPLDGLIAATALPFREDARAPAGLRPDLDRYAEHCRWLLDNGCHGLGVNGTLGEYASLTDTERRAVTRMAIDAAGNDHPVLAGVHAPGAHQARHWAELAAEDGADGVFCMPPTLYRASWSDLIHHYTEVAKAGIPIVIDNSPVDARVDLTPDLLAELAQIENVVAVAEFSGDVRRVLEISNRTPGLRLLTCPDDLALESLLVGATGWFAAFANVFPAECARLLRLTRQGSLAEARTYYQRLLGAFRWASRVEFVQAIKFGMDYVGRYGGPCRPPRGPLTMARLDQLEVDLRHTVEELRNNPSPMTASGAA